MKATFISIVMLVFGTLAINKTQAQLGIRLGGNFSSMSVKNGNTTQETDGTSGLNFGIVNNFGSNNLQFKTGLLFNQKGYEISFLNQTNKITFNYLEVPLHTAYTLEFSEKLGLQIEAGPYLGFLATAYSKVNSTSTKLDLGNNNNISRIDGGLDIGAAINISKFQIGLHYGMGLLNLSKNSNTTYRNNVLSLNLVFHPFKK